MPYIYNMARRAARVDANQKEIVTMLRRMGYSVAVTSDCGKGFPDIVVGRSGKNYLFENQRRQQSTISAETNRGRATIL